MPFFAMCGVVAMPRDRVEAEELEYDRQQDEGPTAEEIEQYNYDIYGDDYE